MFAGLTLATLTLWFFIGFPWQHHNESLVWAVELARTRYVDTLISNPITPVQTYRPLGVGLAWLSVHLSGGSIAPQQLLNYLFTAAAWLVAFFAAPSARRGVFALLAFVAIGGFFSGYIYLFHLHGVFYGPLLLYLALLQRDAGRGTELGFKQALCGLALAGFFALFHTFALLFFAAWICGRWLQNRIERRSASLAAALLVIVAAAVAMKLLVAHSADLVQGSAIAGMLASYRALELNIMLSALAAMLTLLAAMLIPASSRLRLSAAAVALGLCAVLWASKLPVVWAWVLVCALRALFACRFTSAALLAVTALLPVATATGSPTYALFVVMPCVAITVADGSWMASERGVLTRLSIVALAATLAIFIGIKMDWRLPVVSRLVAPLQAEREKTEQLQRLFAWLDQHSEIHGELELCQPGDFPVRSNTAIERQYRAPTHAWPFHEYLQARYNGRLTEATGPRLGACFGGQRLQGDQLLLSIPGRWAGDAALVALSAIGER